jgi:hypothetical protein
MSWKESFGDGKFYILELVGTNPFRDFLGKLPFLLQRLL